VGRRDVTNHRGSFEQNFRRLIYSVNADVSFVAARSTTFRCSRVDGGIGNIASRLFVVFLVDDVALDGVFDVDGGVRVVVERDG
jgi:hypothetical protein